MGFFIPLRNKDKSIIAFSVVDEDDFIILNKYKWYKNIADGYVNSTINGKTWKLHRFIMINILNNDLDSKTNSPRQHRVNLFFYKKINS